MLRVALRLVVDALLVMGVLVASAGTSAWWRAWVAVTVMLFVRSVGAIVAFRTNPRLLQDRARLPLHRDQARTDKLLVLTVLATGFLGVPLVAALDVFRGQWGPAPAAWVCTLGLTGFTAGWSLKSLALQANAFAVGEVRPQRAQGQTVADAGVYGVVRHPFYAADPLIHVGLGLWLGSWLAALAAAVPVGLMVVRLVREERFLRSELPAYAAYANRVRYRLVPGLW